MLLINLRVNLVKRLMKRINELKNTMIILKSKNDSISFKFIQ